MSKKSYPFSAIIGQESMKKGLILNIINPRREMKTYNSYGNLSR